MIRKGEKEQRRIGEKEMESRKSHPPAGGVCFFTAETQRAERFF
jgi:hypothetical protein